MELTRNSLFLGIIILVLAGIYITIVRYTTESKELTAIREDRITNAVFLTGTEINRTYQDQENTLLGKPIRAQMRVEFEPTANYSSSDVFNEIVSKFEVEGWHANELSTQSDYFTATLQKGDFSLLGEVYINHHTNIVGIHMLEIGPQPPN
ncbi:MAG: hypothetical protein AAF902_10825 [Chloroflexota bacterium]